MHSHVDGPERSGPDEEPSLIDAAQLRNYARFSLRALRRHAFLASAVFVVTVGAAAATLAVLPKTYHADGTLLAHHNDLMTSLTNPSRPLRTESDDATLAASETIHDRENLERIVEQTDLVNQWERSRWLASRLKDQITRRLRRP